MGPAFGRHVPRCAPRAPVALSCPPIQLSVSRVAASGGELAAPWPSCAPCGPSAPVAYPVPPAGREASRLRTPPDAARGVPAASRPAHGGGSNARKRASAAPNGGVRLRPRRRHSRRGPLGACAPWPPVPPVTGSRAPAGLRQMPSAAIACNRTSRHLLFRCPPLSIWLPPALPL